MILSSSSLYIVFDTALLIETFCPFKDRRMQFSKTKGSLIVDIQVLKD